jgi:hypothetical protein
MRLEGKGFRWERTKGKKMMKVEGKGREKRRKKRERGRGGLPGRMYEDGRERYEATRQEIVTGKGIGILSNPSKRHGK